MKSLFFTCALFVFFTCKNEDKYLVELSCGQCQFGLDTQKGCDLAVRIDDKAYFVDGANIDDYGDAHDKDTGFCEVIRKAEVKGQLKDDRFEVTAITLLE